MNRQTLLLYVLLGITITVVFALIIGRFRSHTQTPSEALPPSEPGSSAPSVQLNHSPDEMEPSPDVSPVNARSVEPVSEADMTPFLRSEVAEKWQRELGYTQAEIVAAQKKIRADRYPEKNVNDPGMIMRYLPVRHTGQVSIESVTVANEVKAGQPVPFSIRGLAPSPSFRFTHFNVLVQGSVIRVQARGNADGETTLGTGGPLALDGTIDPLPPGSYSIEVTELGPLGSFPFTVVE